jgi:hypothetical protein
MPYEETYGARIRQFIQELFGSRLTAHLEDEITRLRNDHDRALQDRDTQIAVLREEKQLLMSKITAYEFAVLPRTSRAGAEVIAYQKPAPPKPNFSFADLPPTKSKWEQFQENYYAGEAKAIEAEKAAAAAVAAQKQAEAAAKEI